jgi:phosphotriesterase-related protein
MSTVTSVTGPVDTSQLGITLTHEHIVNDVTSWSHRTESRGWDPEDLAHRVVTTDVLWDLKHDPFANLDNCRLDDPELATQEVARFASLGGGTILEATGLGIGRDLRSLREVSRRTGTKIIAGTGYYLDAAQPDHVKGLHPDDIAEHILTDLSEGEDGVRPGFIGEIGVGEPFTKAEEASLRGAFLAQRETGLPVQVHLPGWFRSGDLVLDLAEEHAVDPSYVVLCHMGPSGADVDYQHRLLRRGAYVQYDMIGMEVYYADQDVQCPSDEENARRIADLVDSGFGSQLLLSQDVFLKSLLRRYGGPGYSHILQYFVPRLLRLGLGDDDVTRLLVHNPRALFESR